MLAACCRRGAARAGSGAGDPAEMAALSTHIATVRREVLPEAVRITVELDREVLSIRNGSRIRRACSSISRTPAPFLSSWMPFSSTTRMLSGRSGWAATLAGPRASWSISKA